MSNGNQNQQHPQNQQAKPAAAQAVLPVGINRATTIRNIRFAIPVLVGAKGWPSVNLEQDRNMRVEIDHAARVVWLSMDAGGVVSVAWTPFENLVSVNCVTGRPAVPAAAE